MGFTVQFLLGTVLVLLCCLSIQSTQDAEKTTEKIKIEEVTSNIENLTTNKPKTENSTETKQQNSVGLNLEKNEEEPKEIGRSIDIEKYVSKEFHNKNNVYTLPTSPDTEKYIDHEYDFHETTQKHHEEFNYETELTTPKSSIFDQKYQQAVESVDQKLEHIDDSHEISAEIEPKESIDVEKLYEETKKNDTKADLNFVNFKNFQTNDTGSKNSLHKNVVLESGTNLNFQRSYNHTTVENESGNNTIVKEPEKKIETTTLSNVIKSELEKAESSTMKTTLTTRKSLVLTKPPNRNSSHISILSNNIETETVKAINPTTESTWKSPTDITRRGSVKYAHTLTTEPTGITNNINKKSEQLLQENQVIPVHVEAPPSAQNVTTTIPVKISTTTSYVTHSTETATTATTIQVKDTTTTPEIPTTIQVKIGTTTAEIPTKIQANISTTTAEIPTTKIQAKIGSTTAEIPTTKIQANISTTTAEIPTTKIQAKIGSTTAEIPTTKIQANISTTTAEIPTTKLQAKIGTTVETPTTKMQAKISTTTPDISTTMQEETTTELQSTTTPETETKITYSVEARIKTVSVATQTTPQTETTTETTTTELQTTFLADSTAATTEMPETTTETVNTSENIVRTSKGMNFGENFPTIPDTTTEMQTTEMTTTEKVPAVNVIPKMGPVVTTVEPEVKTTTFDRTDLVPEFKTAGPETTEAETTENHTITSDSYELTTDPPSDNSGTIAAIAISSVAAICLIGVAILLVIMRKRQKRFNYGQRCRPVNLDDYSMDNVSVYNSVRRKGLLRGSKRSYGNPAFEDPVSVSHPLNFPALGKFANNFEDIKAEFEEIPQITARTNELPEGCETKNRYANVIPLPETRVLLNLIEGYPNSDYINANYVTGPKNTKGYYIACQAPMQNTVDDFWRMIWEQQCKVVLMLTHLFENGVEKCVDYLPPSEVLDCHRLFGDFQVTLKKREVKDKYIISSLQLKNMVSNSWREVTHFWYLGWPEKGVPSEANSLIAFLIEARSYMKSSSIDRKEVTNGNLMNGAAKNEVNPVVVHCSPGTGRTGVVIACDIAIREFEQTRLVDVPKIVYKIRRDRASAVQTKEQYTFIYKVINLYATKLTGGALDSL